MCCVCSSCVVTSMLALKLVKRNCLFYNCYFARGSSWEVLWWVRLYVCVCLSVYEDISGTTQRDLHQFLCLLPIAMALSSSSIVVKHYVLPVCGWHHVISHSVPYSGMNLATKDQFHLNWLIYRKVGQNLITYY